MPLVAGRGFGRAGTGALKPEVMIVKVQDNRYGVYILFHEVREVMVLEE